MSDQNQITNKNEDQIAHVSRPINMKYMRQTSADGVNSAMMMKNQNSYHFVFTGVKIAVTKKRNDH